MVAALACQADPRVTAVVSADDLKPELPVIIITRRAMSGYIDRDF